MQNVIPKRTSEVLTLAADMAAGAGQYSGTIPLTVVTEAMLVANTTDVVEAAAAYEQAKTVLKTRFVTARTSMETGHAFLMKARDSFKTEFGQRYHQGWDPTGLVGSLEIVESEAKVIGLLRSFKTFLANNAAFETESKGITATQAGTLLTQLQAARTAIHQQEKLVGDMLLDRNAKVKVLRSSISDMIGELKLRLAPLDTRWLAFGLNKPGAKPAPVAPLNVAAVLIGPNAAAVTWDQSTYANHYRVWAKVVGVDQELINVGNSDNTEFTLQALTAGTQVQVAVSAVSDGGESAKSEIVTVTMPA